MAIYGCWIVSVVEACDKVLLNGHKKIAGPTYMVIWWQMKVSITEMSWKYCYVNSLTSDKLQGNMHYKDSARDR